VLSAPPAFSAAQDLRITGYGADSTPPQFDQVQQTHAGAWASATSTRLTYRADTMGGNSGSPVIHEPTGVAIGIHTHGGCTSSGGANSGTASTHPGLQAALANPQGVCRTGIALEGVPPVVLTPGIATLVQVRAAASVVPGSVLLHERDGAGAFVPHVMSNAGGGLYGAFLPAYECGAQPQYYFSAVDHGGVALVAQDAADRACDLRRREARGRHLIEQWLEQMVVAAVDDRDVDRRTAQRVRGGEPAEAGADDDDSRTARSRGVARGRSRRRGRRGRGDGGVAHGGGCSASREHGAFSLRDQRVTRRCRCRHRA
jgi:hypothetical protein